MNIPKDQLAYKPKKIGKLKGLDVLEVEAVGGLAIVFVAKSDGNETLGLGSHVAIARHVAMSGNPDLKLTELQKSEDLPPWLVEQLAKSEEAHELTENYRKFECELKEKNDE